jgi:hypothetical protein
MKSREVKWVGHLTHLKEIRNACRILVEELKLRDILRDLALDGRLILKWILKRVWTGFVRLRICSSGRLGSIKSSEFIE